MATCENWQLFVHDKRHNHAIGVYTHGHAQAAKLTEEQLRQTEQFKKSHVPPRSILRFFQKQNVGCAIRYVALTLMHPGESLLHLRKFRYGLCEQLDALSPFNRLGEMRQILWPPNIGPEEKERGIG
ncbi:hypothetical protein M9H77_19274 [Catharanthus roseus]|uniref:Uncharacterized protein n=1 Tax=Catharanthus roseus TaxID=4058 RepID=A0ACC0B9U6_CATRO|nr:hypothetical protein M9H77_19274 [Catharanthus roseus]